MSTGTGPKQAVRGGGLPADCRRRCEQGTLGTAVPQLISDINGVEHSCTIFLLIKNYVGSSLNNLAIASLLTPLRHRFTLGDLLK